MARHPELTASGNQVVAYRAFIADGNRRSNASLLDDRRNPRRRGAVPCVALPGIARPPTENVL